MALKYIDDVYPTYFQKSRLFLTPLIGFKKDKFNLPKNSYVLWENKYSLKDRKFILEYKKTNNTLFKIFEDTYLISTELFEYKFEYEDSWYYVYDLSEHSEIYDKVVQSKYSELPSSYKKVILKHIGKAYKKSYEYASTYLYPKSYYRDYAKLLSVNNKDFEKLVEILKENVELCDTIDLEKENLRINPNKIKIIYDCKNNVSDNL